MPIKWAETSWLGCYDILYWKDIKKRILQNILPFGAVDLDLKEILCMW